jgi:hypothetical protein
MASNPSPLDDSPEYQAFRRFIRLHALKRELNAQLREIEPQLRALEPVLLGYLGENGYEMIKIDGFTLSPRREPWIYPQNGISRASVCEALKLSGLGRFVNEGYSTRSLTAYVRELEQHHALVAGSDPATLRELLPPPLAHVLEVRPGFKLQVLDKRIQKGPLDENEEGEDNYGNE